MTPVADSAHGVIGIGVSGTYTTMHFHIAWEEAIMTTIFVRERRKVETGERKPRYRVVGVHGKDVKLYAEHIRKRELEIIAEKSGAEIVYLPVDGGGDGSGGMKEK